MLLAALWYSREKPNINTYLRPLIDEINELYTTGKATEITCIILTIFYVLGITVSTPRGVQNARAILLVASVDLPARAILMNMKQFNGEYGCLYCENPGTTTPGKHLHRYWPRTASSIRNHDSLLENAVDAVQNKKPV